MKVQVGLINPFHRKLQYDKFGRACVLVKGAYYYVRKHKPSGVYEFCTSDKADKRELEGAVV